MISTQLFNMFLLKPEDTKFFDS